MQQQIRLFWFVTLLITALVVVGCRVESAGIDEKPTPRGQDRILISSNRPTQADNDFTVPTQEVGSENITPVAQDFASFTPTIDFAATSTPTVDTQLGQGGFTGDLVPFTQQPSVTFTQQVFPTQAAQFVPTNTEVFMPTSTHTATATPTYTPTATATPTSTATATATATLTNTPTLTPTATLTEGPSPTITPFPIPIGGGPSTDPTLVAQSGFETPNPQQITATYIIQQATQNAAATLGTPPITIGATTDPLAGQGGVDSSTTGQFAPTATGFPDCTIRIPPDISLSQIARQYNLTTEALAAYNNITNPDYIRAGDELIIPGCGLNPTPTPTINPTTGAGTTQPVYDNSTSQIVYTVVEGDTIYKLSERFGVTMTQIITLNPIADINLISVGQQLIIPPRSRPVTTLTPTPTTLAPTG
ncbi:MAG: hypothetical protein CUN55_14545 [Phototrophicales bacterium]|nr:MAG: hypothetical protein CUN55_14545 [Phototrophicales bacterium]